MRVQLSELGKPGPGGLRAGTSRVPRGSGKPGLRAATLWEKRTRRPLESLWQVGKVRGEHERSAEGQGPEGGAPGAEGRQLPEPRGPRSPARRLAARAARLRRRRRDAGPPPREPGARASGRPASPPGSRGSAAPARRAPSPRDPPRPRRCSPAPPAAPRPPRPCAPRAARRPAPPRPPSSLSRGRAGHWLRPAGWRSARAPPSPARLGASLGCRRPRGAAARSLSSAPAGGALFPLEPRAGVAPRSLLAVPGGRRGPRAALPPAGAELAAPAPPRPGARVPEALPAPWPGAGAVLGPSALTGPGATGALDSRPWVPEETGGGDAGRAR